MSNLARLALTSGARKLITLRSTQLVSARSCGWVQDWKPAPYPRTKEEREAAARRYNLIPEDYEPHEEGSGFGDYPNLPVVSQDVKDMYDEYDYYYRRRNFGETLHIDYDVHMSDKSNPNVRYRYSPWIMIPSFLAFGVIFVVAGYVDRYFDLHTGSPYKPKQYPADGKKHYTFEPLD